MMAAQHNCKGLLKFILPDDMVTVNAEVMTLTGIHIFKQDRNRSEESFIPWSKENMPPPAFLKRDRETQTKKIKRVLESILDQDLEKRLDLNDPVNVLK